MFYEIIDFGDLFALAPICIDVHDKATTRSPDCLSMTICGKKNTRSSRTVLSSKIALTRAHLNI